MVPSHMLQCLLHTQLLRLLAGKKKKMPFVVPMIWREQVDHSTDYYFCLTNIKKFSRKNKSKIKYPNCRSAMKPVQHSSTDPIRSSPLTVAFDQDASSSQSKSSSKASVCEMFLEENEPNPQF